MIEDYVRSLATARGFLPPPLLKFDTEDPKLPGAIVGY